MIADEDTIEEIIHLLVTQTPMDEAEARYICTHFSYGFPIEMLLQHPRHVKIFAQGMLQMEDQQKAERRVAMIPAGLGVFLVGEFTVRAQENPSVDSIMLDLDFPRSETVLAGYDFDFDWPVKEEHGPARVKGHLYQQRRYGGDRGHPIRARPGKGRR